MKVEKKGHTTIIKETKGDFNLFLNTSIKVTIQHRFFI